MRDHRIDRGASALGVLFIIMGLAAFAWVATGSDPAVLTAVLPYLGPLLIIGFGAVVLVMAITPDGGRRAQAAPRSAASAGAPPTRPVAVPLGAAHRADLEIAFGAGRLRVGRSEPGHLVDGVIVGGGVEQDQAGRVRLWSDDPWLEWVPGLQRDWTIGVTGEVPVRMEVRAGAAEVDLDCRDLRLEELVVRSGASSVRVQAAAHGQSRIRTENGAGSLDVTVPIGVAARVRTTALLGSREIDLARFPAAPGGYETPGFAEAADRVEIDAQTAVGSLRVR
jgi:hypothetical protein